MPPEQSSGKAGARPCSPLSSIPERLRVKHPNFMFSVERSPAISTSTSTGTVNTPYGGSLVDLTVSPERGTQMKAAAKDYASLTLDERGLCDLELLSVGGFSPLRGFMGKADYDRVVGEMRLSDGTLWPLPVTLPVTPGDDVKEGKTLALRDVYGNLLAFLHIEEIYAADKEREAELAYGSLDKKAPRRGPSRPPARLLRGGQARGDPHPAPL